MINSMRGFKKYSLHYEEYGGMYRFISFEMLYAAIIGKIRHMVLIFIDDISETGAHVWRTSFPSCVRNMV